MHFVGTYETPHVLALGQLLLDVATPITVATLPLPYVSFTANWQKLVPVEEGPWAYSMDPTFWKPQSGGVGQ